MKIRTDIVKMYKEIHGWVGIVSGLALFIAFYAGAITMFEVPLQRWASPNSHLAEPVSLERAPELIQAVIARHPEAAKGYQVNVETSADRPARVSWDVREPGADEHSTPRTFHAALAADGSLQVQEDGPSPVAQFVDVLHQQVGLPLPHEVAMPIMGAIALLYAIAMVSGVIVLLPSLVKDFFAVRVGKNVKRMWLDLHNVLGIMSLPFHLVMALTSVVFAFHDQFYLAQGLAFSKPATEIEGPPPASRPRPQGERLPPTEIVRQIEAQAPGFRVKTMVFSPRPAILVMGEDPRYGMRGPTFGVAQVSANSGKLVGTSYMPGKQDGWGATFSSFFALHFGNFGGTGVRWAYFLLGIAGAFLFYTGNLLWVESRRKRERKAGAVEQSRSTKVLAALTVGVPLGCVAGIAVTVAAAKALGGGATEGLHSAIYYAVFLAFTGWALLRGAPRASLTLLPATAVAFLTIPLASALYLGAYPPTVPLVDGLAVAGTGLTALAWRSAARRTGALPHDSVWAMPSIGSST